MEGLELGADDYLVKPFAFWELLARVRTLLRRGAAPVSNDQMQVANLVLDIPAEELNAMGHESPLQTRSSPCWNSSCGVRAKCSRVR